MSTDTGTREPARSTETPFRYGAALADEIEQRCAVGSPADIEVQLTKREARLFVPGLVGWRPRRIGPRFEHAFGRRLVVSER